MRFLLHESDQSEISPPSPRDWLPENHLAWFTSDTADALDLRAFCRRVRYNRKVWMAGLKRERRILDAGDFNDRSDPRRGQGHATRWCIETRLLPMQPWSPETC